MADIKTIKSEVHRASCAELLTLKSEADVMVSASPELLNWFLHHVYREYNRRRFNLCGGLLMIEPYGAGFVPIGYTPSTGGLSVANGMAQAQIDGITYEWPVEVGGVGAAANEFAVTNGVITFTVSSVNYQFVAWLGGAGSATMDVTNDLATATISSVNYEWAVTVV